MAKLVRLVGGKVFSLRKETLAVEVADGRRTAVCIPSAGIVEVMPGFKEGDQMVEVRWEQRVLHIFAVDLVARGVEIWSHKGTAKAESRSATA